MNAASSVAIECSGSIATAWSTSSPAADPMPSAHASHAAMHSGAARCPSGACAAAQRTRSSARRTRRWSGRRLVWPSSSRPRRSDTSSYSPLGELAPHQLVDRLAGLGRPRRSRPRRRRARLRRRPARTRTAASSRRGWPAGGQVQEPGELQRRARRPDRGESSDSTSATGSSRCGEALETALTQRSTSAKRRQLRLDGAPRSASSARREHAPASGARRDDAAVDRQPPRCRRSRRSSRADAPTRRRRGIEHGAPAVGRAAERVADVESRLLGAAHEQRQQAGARESPRAASNVRRCTAMGTTASTPGHPAEGADDG